MYRHDEAPVGTGIPGLDEVLEGGLTPNRLYLVEGHPGAGKTTLALQFLFEGVRVGQSVLYMTLSESALELQAVAASHGWSLEGVTVREYVLHEATFGDDQVTMFHPAEVELGETLQRMLADIDELRPARVVLDALTELRLLAETTMRYRRQLLAFKRFFLKRHCTALLLDDSSGAPGEPQVQSVMHGVLMLERVRMPYGSDRRQLRVGKLRGRAFRSGAHEYEIRRGGIDVFPRLDAAGHAEPIGHVPLASGLPALDALLGGGPQFGTAMLLTGPGGTGKTTIAMHYALNATRDGQAATVFTFDETPGTLTTRLRAIGLDAEPAIAAGRLRLRQVDPVEMSPGEFAHRVRVAVERDGTRLVVIDSLNGYLNAMPGEGHLTAQLHELLAYLANRGVLSVLVLGQTGSPGSACALRIDPGYLCDTILLMRFFEAGGQVRKAISVTKKRLGGHESSPRELVIGRDGVHIGAPLDGFRGLLTDQPRFAGPTEELLLTAPREAS